MRQHWLQHYDICMLITSLKNEGLQYLYFDEWIALQKKFVQLIQMSLGREIKPYEVQMIMFAKSCFICHQRNIFYTCNVCLSVSYCVDHVNQIYMHHEAVCTQLAISLQIDIVFFNQTISEALNIKFSTFPNTMKSFTDMDSFCTHYYHTNRRHDYYGLTDYVVTDCVSDPLTLYDGLRSVKLFSSIKLTDTFIIHVIGADYVNKQNFPAWELFLHLLNKKTKLIVVMIGPELQYESNKCEVCSHCRVANKRLIFESFSLLYHNYVHHVNYRRPNVIIGFQTELGYGETWSDSIISIQGQNCPLLLTTISLIKGQENIIMIKTILGTSVEPIFQNENNFVSCRPYRDFETGHLLYRNMYLIIYKNLK